MLGYFCVCMRSFAWISGWIGLTIVPFTYLNMSNQSFLKWRHMCTWRIIDRCSILANENPGSCYAASYNAYSKLQCTITYKYQPNRSKP